MSAPEHGGNVFAIARSLGVDPGTLVDFSASINPLGLPPGVRQALISSLDDLLHYPDSSACRLKESIAAHHGVPKECVAVANGSTELIHLIPGMLPPGRALIVAPAFSEYRAALSRCGWSFDYFTLESGDSFRLSLDDLRRALSRGYRLLFLCNPGNPTGALLPRQEVEEIMALCERAGAFLVLDEAFMDFCEEESAKGVLRDFAGGLLLRSMTKFYAIPGLRLGYAIGAPKTIASLGALQPPWSVNTAAQVAGIAALGDREYQERARILVERERARLAAGLNSLRWISTFPSRANYLLARLENGYGAPRLREALLEKGLLIRDCSNFQGLDERFFRVAVKSAPENDRLLHELATLV